MGNVTEADGQEPQHSTPGFGERGRMRRRARFLRKARELAYRDLGGLVFDLHRFGERNDQVVTAKLQTLRQIDGELRALEEALNERRPVTVLQEVGIAACPRCAAIHGRDDRFCPGCGLAFDTHAERPLATAPTGAHAHGAAAPLPGHTQIPPPTEQRHAAPATPAAAAGPAGSGAGQPAAAPPGQAASAGEQGPAPVQPPAPKPSAPPVAAPRTAEDEPTQVLRPPVSGG